jgi:homoserine O-acetyltransferase
MQLLDRARVDARYLEIDSEFGHLATGADAPKWAAVLAAFMAELQR